MRMRATVVRHSLYCYGGPTSAGGWFLRFAAGHISNMSHCRSVDIPFPCSVHGCGYNFSSPLQLSRIQHIFLHFLRSGGRTTHCEITEIKRTFLFFLNMNYRELYIKLEHNPCG